MIDEKLIDEWREPETTAAIAKLRRPPARFIGGKYGAKGALLEALSACGGGFDLAIDPFGGSGLVSRVIKDSGMAKRVIYGDFDDYSARVRYIHSPEAVARHRWVVDALSGVGRDQAIPDEVMRRIAAGFDGAPEPELDVWLPYLSFAGKDSSVRDLLAVRRYNRVPVKWPRADGWLDDLEVVLHVDARQILESFKPFPGRTLVVLDPPYPGTHGASYRDSTWTIGDYVDMINSTLRSGADTILLFGDDRSGVEAMMATVPANKVKRIEFAIRTNGTATGSLDSAYIIRRRSR